MSDIAISVQNLTKIYKLYDSPKDRIKEVLHPLRRQYHKDCYALSDISFDVLKGETVGIIGKNGSGKSTLLKILTGVVTPTRGVVTVNGKLAALLELGAGFNPELTGIENVYLNGTLMGYTREEIEGRLDDILAFADIGNYIRQPVKMYSSGMFVRLAFAVNIMVQPEVMVVDEALSVGDIAFQAKCMTALKRIQDHGATVLLVSHDTGSIKSLCERVAYLEDGRLKHFGEAARVAEAYVQVMREEMSRQNADSFASSPPVSALQVSEESDKSYEFKQFDEFDRRVEQFRYGNGNAKVAFAELLDINDQPLLSVEFNQKVKIRFYFSVDSEVDLSANYYILDEKKNLILGAGFRTVGKSLLHCDAGGKYIVTYLTNLPLQEGDYSVQLQLTRPVILDQTAEFLDVIEDAIVFSVTRRRVGRIWTKVFLPNTVEVIQI